ncbi:MAG: regulatory protein RecX [Gammaproteobacteria bacterium]|nr:regulatory protein RecX [Gammaproteobacteria bacterium]
MSGAEISKLERAALRLLVAREHSRWELRRKLNAHAAQPEHIERLLDRLEEQGVQSDLRFTQEYIAARGRRGFGPIRIAVELNERGIAAALVEACLDPDGARWEQILLETAKSKFGGNPPEGYEDWARRARFLEYRGFTTASIRRLLPR